MPPERLIDADRQPAPRARTSRNHSGTGAASTARGDGDDGQRQRDTKDPIAQRRTHADDCTLHAIWHTVANSVARLSTARPGYAAAALLLYIVSLVIAGARWRGFLRALGGDVTRHARDAGDARRHRRRQPDAVAGRRSLPHRPGPHRRPRDLAQATIAAVWDRLSELPPILVLTAMALVAVRHARRFGWRASTHRWPDCRSTLAIAASSRSGACAVRDSRLPAGASACAVNRVSASAVRGRRRLLVACCGSRTSCG